MTVFLRVGSGKTTFLLHLLGSLTEKGLKDGQAWTCGFCAQEPWLWNGSIKENIVGPAMYSQEWYLQVILACDLVKDINSLAAGHDTIVGSAGASLSGGQRKRIVRFCASSSETGYKSSSRDCRPWHAQYMQGPRFSFSMTSSLALTR